MDCTRLTGLLAARGVGGKLQHLEYRAAPLQKGHAKKIPFLSVTARPVASAPKQASGSFFSPPDPVGLHLSKLAGLRVSKYLSHSARMRVNASCPPDANRASGRRPDRLVPRPPMGGERSTSLTRGGMGHKDGRMRIQDGMAYLGKPRRTWRVAKNFLSAALDPPGIRFQSYPDRYCVAGTGGACLSRPQHPAFCCPCGPRALHYTLWGSKATMGGQQNPTTTEAASRRRSW